MSTQEALDECLARLEHVFTPAIADEIRERDFEGWPWFGFGVEEAVKRSCLEGQRLRRALCGLGECNLDQLVEAILYCKNRQLNVGVCKVGDFRYWRRSGPLSDAERLPSERLPSWAALARHDQVVPVEVAPALRILDLLADVAPLGGSELEGYPVPEVEKLLPLLADSLTLIDPNRSPRLVRRTRQQIEDELSSTRPGLVRTSLLRLGEAYSHPDSSTARVGLRRREPNLVLDLGFGLYELEYESGDEEVPWRLCRIELLWVLDHRQR